MREERNDSFAFLVGLVRAGLVVLAKRQNVVELIVWKDQTIEREAGDKAKKAKG